MESRDTSSQEQEGLAGEVMDSLGVPESHEEDISSEGKGSNQDPLYVQKRLKQQKRSHEREIREMQTRMNEMQSRLSEQSQPNQMSGMYNGGNNDMHSTIHEAVSLALNHRDEMERKQREAEKMQHVHRQYNELQRHLDQTADKYEDFDDLVRGYDAPFTEHMRDAALMLPRTGPGSAGEVLYKLGKDRDVLNKVKNLHPMEQAAEMVKLSQALVNEARENRNQSSQTMGNIKSNPVTNTAGISEKTSIGDLRRRMRQGWK